MAVSLVERTLYSRSFLPLRSPECVLLPLDWCAQWEQFQFGDAPPPPPITTAHLLLSNGDLRPDISTQDVRAVEPDVWEELMELYAGSSPALRRPTVRKRKAADLEAVLHPLELRICRRGSLNNSRFLFGIEDISERRPFVGIPDDPIMRIYVDADWTVFDLQQHLSELSSIASTSMSMTTVVGYPDLVAEGNSIPDVEPQDRTQPVAVVVASGELLVVANMRVVKRDMDLRLATAKEAEGIRKKAEQDDDESVWDDVDLNNAGNDNMGDGWDVDDVAEGQELEDFTGRSHSNTMKVSSDEDEDDGVGAEGGVRRTRGGISFNFNFSAQSKSKGFSSLANRDDDDDENGDTFGTGTGTGQNSGSGSSALVVYGAPYSGRSFGSRSPYSTISSSFPANAKPGLCGLRNLGNTCYMNSGLQLISSIRPLVKELLQPNFQSLVRPDNPLGWGGDIASGLSAVVRQMWSGLSAFSPARFKTLLGRVNPMFEGYGQHDCQEFLTFMLDALHEDINAGDFTAPRDCNFADPEAVWSVHRRRNASFLVDLLHGMYRSTVVCDSCNKSVVRYEPFMNLPVQLPVSNERRLELTWCPLGMPPLRFAVTVPKSATIATLKSEAGRLFGVPTERIMMREVLYSRMSLYSFYDAENISKLGDRGDYALFELPPPRSTTASSTTATATSSSTANAAASSFPSSSTVVSPSAGNDISTSLSAPVPDLQSQDDPAPMSDPLTGSTTDASSSSAPPAPATVAASAPASAPAAPIPPPASSVAVPDECFICCERSAFLFRHNCQELGVCEACCEQYQTSKGFDTKTFHICPVCNQMTQESEWTQLGGDEADNEVQVTSTSTAAVPPFVIVMLRRARYSTQTLCGHPFLLPLPAEGLTGVELHAAAAIYLQAANVAEEFIRSVQLVVCNEYGTSCKSCNSYACTGCSPIEPTDDVIVFPRDSTLILSWATAGPLFQTARHESMQAGAASAGPALTLESCLQHFSEPETVQWMCPTCNVKRDGRKTLELWAVPDVVVVHLKRFRASGDSREKIDAFVGFPEYLDFGMHCVRQSSDGAASAGGGCESGATLNNDVLSPRGTSTLEDTGAVAEGTETLSTGASDRARPFSTPSVGFVSVDAADESARGADTGDGAAVEGSLEAASPPAHLDSNIFAHLPPSALEPLDAQEASADVSGGPSLEAMSCNAGDQKGSSSSSRSDAQGVANNSESGEGASATAAAALAFASVASNNTASESAAGEQQYGSAVEEPHTPLLDAVVVAIPSDDEQMGDGSDTLHSDEGEPGDRSENTSCHPLLDASEARDIVYTNPLFSRSPENDDVDSWAPSSSAAFNSTNMANNMFRAPELAEETDEGVGVCGAAGVHEGGAAEARYQGGSTTAAAAAEARAAGGMPGGGSTLYRLIAVSNHFGGIYGGHYTAYCQRDGSWYEFNDERVSPMRDFSEVETAAAYCLLYERMRDETPLPDLPTGAAAAALDMDDDIDATTRPRSATSNSSEDVALLQRERRLSGSYDYGDESAALLGSETDPNPMGHAYE